MTPEPMMEDPTPAQQVLELFLCDQVAWQVQRTEFGLSPEALGSGVGPIDEALPAAERLVAEVRRRVLADTTSFLYYLDRLRAELDRLILLPDAPGGAADSQLVLSEASRRFMKIKEA